MLGTSNNNYQSVHNSVSWSCVYSLDHLLLPNTLVDRTWCFKLQKHSGYLWHSLFAMSKMNRNTVWN